MHGLNHRYHTTYLLWNSQRVVVLKDQANKKAYEASAQLACEAAGAIRTVASLTREDDCLRIYSLSLEEPLRKSNRTALWSNAIYALSQSMSLYVIALVFWYGATLVSHEEFGITAFFVCLMVRFIVAMIHDRFLNESIEYDLRCHTSRKRVRLRARYVFGMGSRF
jgi:ABC-type bacteriocin/lantibiotic exporter with double-glycine peptidase domain